VIQSGHRIGYRSRYLVLLVVSALLPVSLRLRAQEANREWLNKVRIGAYGLGPNNAEQIVQQARASGAFGGLTKSLRPSGASRPPLTGPTIRHLSI